MIVERAAALSGAVMLLLLGEFAAFWWSDLSPGRVGRSLRAIILSVVVVLTEIAVAWCVSEMTSTSHRLLALVVGVVFFLFVFTKMLHSQRWEETFTFFLISLVPVLLAHVVVLFIVGVSVALLHWRV